MLGASPYNGLAQCRENRCRYLVLERLAKPAIIGRIWVPAHEGIVNRLVSVENLPMHLALVVIPDFAAWLRENSLYRKQEAHLLWLEDATLRIDERDAIALEHKARLYSVVVR
jgi:hypothetical protein